ncbi:WAT1-related protein At4g08300-like isoform X4 [Quercus robur]|uniref:WAT1-related protein At4g08300-like isoform X4 n=1 Tax=Quercus robur TaxID=38942 RepID=UPI00216131ED|nr:WAT1-related protein At4g08300-like isoform X4 [Quercus robur]
MAPMVGEMGMICRRFKPHILMVLIHVGYMIMYLITDAAFSHGMNPHIFVTYRHVLGGLVMFPFAYFLERKVRPKMTLALFFEMFLLSLVGVSLTLNMYFASLEYTSPTFGTSMINVVASLTFVIPVALRLEALDARNARGIAKVVGTLISLAGVMTMTLYKGPEVRSWKGAPIHLNRSNSVHENWIKGPILAGASCISWSLWYIRQAFTLKKYPAQLSLTAWINLIGGAQSAAFTVLIQHKPAAWSIAFNNIDFWSIVYAVIKECERISNYYFVSNDVLNVLYVKWQGVVCSGITIFIQLWCTEQRGPVFVTMFNPLGAVLTALQSYFLLGERLHMGRILGAVVVIIGLYLVLWGKEGDQNHIKFQEKSDLTNDELQGCQLQQGTSKRDVP